MNNKSTSAQVVPRDSIIAFALLCTLFALWGVANNMTDVLLATFKKVMSMSDYQTSWIQIAFYGAYFCLALPAALFIRRFSYKAGVLLGLATYAIGAGLCYPASVTTTYWHFLVAFYVLAGGCAILETAANPYILIMGSGETATQRLNLAQSFNPLGSITGVLLGKWMILSQLNEADATARAAMSADQLAQIQEQELNTVAIAYVTVAVVGLIIWIMIALNRFPHGSETNIQDSLASSIGRLMRHRHWVLGVVAQFFYVGAQIGVWSYTIRYIMEHTDLNEDESATYYLASIIVFSLSRFVCTGLMKVITPPVLLWILSLVAALLALVVMLTGDSIGIYALVGISACMSLMFPTIYGLALQGLGDDTKLGASGLIMAILGGAVLTAVQGRVSDAYGIDAAFAVPLLCFLFIAYYGLLGYKSNDI